MSGWSALAGAIVLAAGANGGSIEQDEGYNFQAASGRFQCAVLASYGSEHSKELEPEVARLARVGASYGRRAANSFSVSAKVADKTDPIGEFYLEMPPDFMVGVMFNSANMQVDGLISVSVPRDIEQSIPAWRARIAQFAAEEFDRRDCSTLE